MNAGVAERIKAQALSGNDQASLWPLEGRMGSNPIPGANKMVKDIVVVAFYAISGRKPS